MLHIQTTLEHWCCLNDMSKPKKKKKLDYPNLCCTAALVCSYFHVAIRWSIIASKFPFFYIYTNSIYISNRHWDLILGSHSFVHEPWDLIIVVTDTHSETHDMLLSMTQQYAAALYLPLPSITHTHTHTDPSGGIFIYFYHQNLYYAWSRYIHCWISRRWWWWFWTRDPRILIHWTGSFLVFFGQKKNSRCNIFSLLLLLLPLIYLIWLDIKKTVMVNKNLNAYGKRYLFLLF